MPAVSFQSVNKAYTSAKGSFQALRDVSFDIEEGEFFGLLGPNGAGKTTLISILAGLNRASAGRVLVRGHDVNTQAAQARQLLGVVPQELVFDPFFTVREALRLQSGYFGYGRENYPWLDELLDIDTWNGELFHLTEAFDNGTMHFEVIGEDGDKVLEFGIGDVADLYETIEDFDEKFEYRGYDAFPTDESENIYLSIDENKGGIFTMSFESDTIPKATDFTYSTGSIGTPEGDWDFINQIFFKGQPLTIDDYLDNWGKAATVEIFTSGGGVIN